MKLSCCFCLANEYSLHFTNSKKQKRAQIFAYHSKQNLYHKVVSEDGDSMFYWRWSSSTALAQIADSGGRLESNIIFYS